VNNLQEILLYPVRDAEARKQFLFACLVALAGFIIPFIPMIFLMGYSAKIMRQIVRDRTKPSMPDWQTSDWSEMFMEGLRLYGAQIVYMLPVIIVMGFAFVSMMGGSIATSISLNDNNQTFAPIGISVFILGMLFIILFSVLALPYAIVVSTVVPHVAVTGSFESAFRFKEWWNIFRKALGQFLLAHVITMVVSWVLMIITQFAMLTIVLLCIVPFLIVPYTAYNILLKNALIAQAYASGLEYPVTE